MLLPKCHSCGQKQTNLIRSCMVVHDGKTYDQTTYFHTDGTECVIEHELLLVDDGEEVGRIIL